MSKRWGRSQGNSEESSRSSGYTSNVAGPRGNGNGKRKPRPPWVRRLKIALLVLSLIILIPTAIFLFIFLGYKNDSRLEVKQFQDLAANLQIPPSEIVSSDGTILYQVSDELREYAHLSEIPKKVQQAMIAAEDRRFYDHSGVDPKAIARTIFSDAKERRMAQGGSTLTMQLAKLVSKNSDKTFQRKMHDMALAMAIEETLTKDQILELYLNEVYFGSHAYGIKAAADVYFGKPLDKLTVAEAALLVRLVRSPSYWNNLFKGKGLDVAIHNRDIVLGIMRDENMIDEKTYESAKAEEPKFNSRPLKSSARYLHLGARYYVDHVLDTIKRQLPDVYQSLNSGGYKVETTLDLKMQSIAEREVRRVVAEHRKDRVSTAAFVLMNTDGQILAEVGGVDYDRNQYNVISQGSRQPGSSFKPFVYASALEAGAISIDDTLPNMPITFPAPPGGKPYPVHNSNNKYTASEPVRRAFALSMNVPAVEVINKVGPETVVRYAHDSFGFVSNLYPGLALALGSTNVNPLEMAQGYSVFATGGDRATPYVINRIIGPSGDTVREFTPRIQHDAFDRRVCAQIDQLMRGVVEYGTGYKANIVPNARGKTGTTNKNTDAWFCGFTDGLIGIGWISNEQMHKDGPPTYPPMGSYVFGGTVTVEFWASIMKAAHDKYGSKFATPHPPAASDNPAPVLEKPVDDAASAAGPDQTKQMGPPDDPNPVDVPVDPDAPDNPTPDTPQPGTSPAPNNRPPVRPKPVPPPVETVEVEVCVQSGMKATVYCPETVTRTFKKGQEPRKFCNVHTG